MQSVKQIRLKDLLAAGLPEVGLCITRCTMSFVNYLDFLLRRDDTFTFKNVAAVVAGF